MRPLVEAMAEVAPANEDDGHYLVHPRIAIRILLLRAAQKIASRYKDHHFAGFQESTTFIADTATINGHQIVCSFLHQNIEPQTPIATRWSHGRSMAYHYGSLRLADPD